MLNKKHYMKIEGMRIEGKTWEEIKERLNEELGVDYDESAYRKPYTTYKSGLTEGTTDIEALETLQRIEIEKKKIGMLRGANNEITRDLALRELYQEQIIEAIDNLPSIRYGDNVNIKETDNENEYLVVLSDLHYDGYFDIKQILDFVLNKLISFVKETQVHKLTIVELGDTIEGASLRPSQLRAIKTGMVSQVIEVSEHYVQFLSTLQHKTNTIIDFHVVTSSNHTQIRPLNTKRNELPDEDLMRVFFKFVQERFRNSVTITVYGDDDLEIELGESKLFLSHGHKYGLSPSNIERVSKDISMYNGVIYDYFFYGHYHQYQERPIDKAKWSKKGQRGDSKAFLLPALAPTKDSYERLGLMGCSPAFAILKFSGGVHKSTELIQTPSFD